MNSTTTSPDQFFGYDVVDSTGNKIGSVDNVWVDDATNALEFIGVKTGWLMGKTHVIPTADAQISNGSITVPYSADQIKDAPSFGGNEALSPDDESQVYSYYGLDRSTAPSPTGLPSGESTGTSDYSTAGTSSFGTSTGTETLENAGEINVPVSEEELQVGKREVSAGTVRLRKVVRTEHQEVPVELRREDVQIERVPASEMTEVPDAAFQERDIEVPVSREEAVVGKEAHVTGQVRVQKNVDTETQTVGDEVRSEDVEVDDSTTNAGRSSTGF